MKRTYQSRNKVYKWEQFAHPIYANETVYKFNGKFYTDYGLLLDTDTLVYRFLSANDRDERRQSKFDLFRKDYIGEDEDFIRKWVKENFED